MSTHQPSFVYTLLESKLRERLANSLRLINTLSKEDLLRCDTNCLTDLLRRFVVVPPMLLLRSMRVDAEVIESVDITFERKTGHTNHSFFIPIEGEPDWLEEVSSQRTAVDDYPLAFLDKKRSRISIRLMLSPEDEEGALKRKLDYRTRLVEQYADSVAAKLIEFNKELTAKMFADFNKRKDAIVKAQRELENIGLPRIHNPEHEEKAVQIEGLLRSLGATFIDTHTQQAQTSSPVSAVSMGEGEQTNAEQLYNKVRELIRHTEPLDEYTARVIVESADDAIKEFGETNQEKKVELRQWKSQAELSLSPATIEELRKRTEGQFLKSIYPKKSVAWRRVLFVTVVLTVLIPAALTLRQSLSARSDTAQTEPSATPLPTSALPAPTSPRTGTSQKLRSDNTWAGTELTTG